MIKKLIRHTPTQSIPLLFLFWLSLISGCTPGNKATTQTFRLPDTYAIQTAPEAPAIEHWWKAFYNEELNRLVEKGLTNNHTLKAAYAALQKAEAVAVKQGAGQFPDIELQGSLSETETHSGGASAETRASSLSLAAAYELDLWGKIRSEKEAALFATKAAKKDLESAGVTIAAAIVNTWKDTVAARARRILLNEIEITGQYQLDLLKLRFQNGMVKGSAVYDQKQILLSVTSQINTLDAEITVLENKLAYLTGDTSSGHLSETKMPMVLPVPGAGIPSDLLDARPDIKAARYRLMASRELVSVASKSRLPNVSLSGSLAITADSFSLSFDDWLSRLAANIAMPVFKGGYLKAEVKRSEAAMNEAFYQYAAITHQAFNEVQDALAREQHQNKTLDLIAQRISAAKSALAHAKLEYQNGSTDYPDVIERYNDLKSHEITQVLEKQTLIEYRVALYRSLGNNWTNDYFNPRKNTHE